MKAILTVCAIPFAIIYPCQWIGGVISNPWTACIVALIFCVIILGIVFLQAQALIGFLNRDRTYSAFAYYYTHRNNDGTWKAFANTSRIEPQHLFDPRSKTITSHETTEEDAIEAVQEELEAIHGRRRWIRSTLA